jgi:hypothetical protein
LPFSYRHFLRQVPAHTIREFLVSRGVDVDERVDWQAEEPRIAQQLAEAIDAFGDDRGSEIIADFERAYHMSDERGYAALLNATPDQAGLAQRLAELENGQERALRVLAMIRTFFGRPKRSATSTITSIAPRGGGSKSRQALRSQA